MRPIVFRQRTLLQLWKRVVEPISFFSSSALRLTGRASTEPSSINKSKHPKTDDVRKKHPDRDDVTKIRNIGITAHIDAGKTTTTERMLYYSGYTSHLGDVDDGDTVTDYMEQERARGITITSATVTFPWKGYKMNLIDTPGHIDFTLEVERSLRVMDGVVAVLDSSAGVEAQTLTVWRQADRYNIPRIIFLNKMDKLGADFYQSVKSVEDKLNVQPLVLHLPIGSERTFAGMIDLVTMTKNMWQDKDHGKSYNSTRLDKSEDASVYEEAYSARTTLVENLANLDDKMADMFLSDADVADIPNMELHNAIRRATILHGAVPVLCGSSLKNKGVQPLLDAVVYYLPDPSQQKHEFVEYYGAGLCALAFKTVHNRQRGPLVFVRLYSGSIVSGGSLYNISRECTEKVSRLLQVQAGEYRDIQHVGPGNVVAIAGLKETITGDTLVTNQKAALSAEREYTKVQSSRDTQHSSNSDSEEDEVISSKPVLAGMLIPEPVFFCSIEPPSLAYQKKLDHALACLTREDPSLRVHVDENTGQTIMSGMGELHLEIIKDRILNEYGVDVDMGELQIAYREAIDLAARETELLDKTIGSKHHKVAVTLSVLPTEDEEEIGEFKVVPDKNSRLSDKPLKRYQYKAVENGILSGLQRGPLLGFPVNNARVEIHEFSMAYGTSVPMISACVSQCLLRAFKKASPVILEPMMTIEINADENRLSAVLADLSQRRSQIMDITATSNSKVVTARTPLSQMMGYSTALRTVTSGTATFSMEISTYEQVDVAEQQRIVHKLTGVL